MMRVEREHTGGGDVHMMLEVEGLSYRYAGGREGLRGLDVAVPRGSRFALLGANGSGKSTLLRCLNGTLRPERGRIRLGGEAVSYARAGLRAWRQRVGLVVQDPEDQLFAPTVYQDVTFGPLNLGLSERAARARADAVLAALQLDHLRETPLYALSFGEKRRVALAGILALQPEVLLLDEVTGGLDPAATTELLAVLRDLHAAGTTILLATHDMDLAYGWADEVAVLEAGRVLRQGSPAAVLADEAVLGRARLGRPLLVETALQLRARGYLPEDAPLPRTLTELTRRLAEAPAASDSV